MAPASLWRKKGLSGLSNADFQPVAAREMSRWRSAFPVK
jgi:hypothetical protein